MKNLWLILYLIVKEWMFSFKGKKKRGFLLSLLEMFIIALESIVSVIRQEKEKASD